MNILEGLLYINGMDVYTSYGAFLCEDREGDNANYAALMKPPSMKSYVAVNFRERDGEKLPAELMPRFEPRDITLQFAICAATKAEFIANYDAFVGILRGGWINLRMPELNKTFRLYYQSCTEWSQITPIADGEVAAKFKVKFREPEPTWN